MSEPSQHCRLQPGRSSCHCRPASFFSRLASHAFFNSHRIAARESRPKGFRGCTPGFQPVYVARDSRSQPIAGRRSCQPASFTWQMVASWLRPRPETGRARLTARGFFVFSQSFQSQLSQCRPFLIVRHFLRCIFE
jgi:hypothetical protein